MWEPLDMSLDDIIKKRSFHSAAAPSPRLLNRQPIVTSPYIMPPPPPLVHQMVASWPGTEVGTKLYVSNLDYGVSDEDIKVLFSEVGMLKHYSINYDRSGRSKGTAEIVYTRQADALAAIQRYNNVNLDGKPMKLEFVGVHIITAAPMPPITGSILGKPNGNVIRQDGILGRGRDLGGAVSRGRGSKRGRGQGKGHGEKVSAESLDADLENYRLQAMEIN